MRPLFRCLEPACPVTTWTEQHDLVPPRSKLTTRAADWAVSLLRDDDTTVAAIARRLGVDWHTVWGAVAPIAERETAAESRLLGVRALGVDEHVWKPSARSPERMVTSMVDLTRDEEGQVTARLLDIVPGRSGPAYAGWLKRTPPGFRDQVTHAALDPFRGYANAIRDELPDTIAVLDAFHVVKLGTQVVDEVRRRTQQTTLQRRGHKDDPLYRIRGLLRRGVEHLTEKQHARLAAGLAAGDPDGEVELAWQVYQRLRSIYGSRRSEGRTVAVGLLKALPSCPIPEVARLGRTLRQWRSHLLAYFDTDGLSNGGTEAINLLIEKTRRLAHGFRNLQNYRLRILLNASGTRSSRHA